MGVYGTSLSFFPELFRTFEYFKMSPKAVSSYKQEGEAVKVRGILQYMKRGDLKMEEDTLSDADVPVLWTKRKLEVKDGFIRHDGTVFRIEGSADWMFEGGFRIYVLETLVGDTGVQKPFDDVDLGQSGYA